MLRAIAVADDDRTPRPLPVPREDRWLQELLLTLRAQNDGQSRTLELIRGEVTHLRQIVATEADCAGRAEAERRDRGDGMRRVFESIDGVKDQIIGRLDTVDERLDRHSQRLGVLEGDRREETGAQKVIRTRDDEERERRKERRELFFKWAAAVLIAASLAIGGWIARLLVE